MRDTIVCNINLFDSSQSIYLMTDNGCQNVGSSTLVDLPLTLVGLCDSCGVNKIHLSGSIRYSEAMCEDILWFAKTKYHIDNIEIEVEQNDLFD